MIIKSKIFSKQSSDMYEYEVERCLFDKVFDCNNSLEDFQCLSTIASFQSSEGFSELEPNSKLQRLSLKLLN